MVAGTQDVTVPPGIVGSGGPGAVPGLLEQGQNADAGALRRPEAPGPAGGVV